MSLNSALKLQGSMSRRRIMSKQQKRIRTTYAAEFEEKAIPFEKEEKHASKEPESLDDLDWFLGSNSSSSSSSSNQRWQRLHHGLKPRQSLKDVCSPSDLAAVQSGLSNILEPETPQASRPRLNLRKLLQQDVAPSETDHAKPLRLIQASTFPPMNARPEKASAAKQSHYQFFASICPSEDVDKKKIVEQKVAFAGKKLNSAWPRLNSFHRQPSRLFSNDSCKTILGRGTTSLAKAESMSGQKGLQVLDRSDSKDAIPQVSKDAIPQVSKPFLKRSLSKEDASERTPDKASKSTLSTSQKHACRCLRIMILGRAGDEDALSNREKEQIFNQVRGADEEVVKFYHAWKELDADFSGEVTFRELLDFGRWRGLLPMHERALKAVLNADAIDERFKVIQMYDLMQVMWPKSQIEDRIWMNEIIDRLALAGGEIQSSEEPLPEEMIVEFKGVFSSIQQTHGSVTTRKLVDAGLIPQETAIVTMRSLVHLGLQEDGELGIQEFLQVMCPKGYYAPQLDSQQAGQ